MQSLVRESHGLEGKWRRCVERGEDGGHDLDGQVPNNVKVKRPGVQLGRDGAPFVGRQLLEQGI